MRYIDILAAFEMEIGMIDDTMLKPSTDDSLFWINQSVGKFVKLRFNGDAVHGTGYEQTEKRRHDLIKLFKQVVYSITKDETELSDEDVRLIKNYSTHSSYDQYRITYPQDFLYALNEDVVICDNNGENEMDTCVFECTQDSFMYRVNNSLTDFHYRFHRARPIRVRDANGCRLLTDKKYKIKQYTLGYLRKPKEITLLNPYDEYTDFEDVTMTEIIKIAALMYLENTGSDRYKTITEEVLTQE